MLVLRFLLMEDELALSGINSLPRLGTRVTVSNTENHWDAWW